MSKRTNKDTLREIRLRTFAIEVVKGKTPQEAYRKAHGGKQYKSNVLTHLAAAYLRKALPMIEEMQQKAVDKSIMTRRECLQRLTKTVRDAQFLGKDQVVIQGIKVLSAMAGYDAPVRTETTLAVSLGDRSEEELRRIAGLPMDAPPQLEQGKQPLTLDVEPVLKAAEAQAEAEPEEPDPDPPPAGQDKQAKPTKPKKPKQSKPKKRKACRKKEQPPMPEAVIDPTSQLPEREKQIMKGVPVTTPELERLQEQFTFTTTREDIPFD